MNQPDRHPVNPDLHATIGQDAQKGVRSYGGEREGGTILLYLTDGASDVTAE